MSVLPLSLFYGSRAEPHQCGFLGRGSLPKREESEGGSLSGPGLGAKLQNRVLRGIAISPLGRAPQLRSSLSALNYVSKVPRLQMYIKPAILPNYFFPNLSAMASISRLMPSFSIFSSKSFTLPSRARIIHPLGLFLSLLFPLRRASSESKSGNNSDALLNTSILFLISTSVNPMEFLDSLGHGGLGYPKERQFPL